MDSTRRTILWIIFSASLFMLYENWQRFNGHPTLFGPPVPAQPAAGGSAPHVPTDDVPVAGTTPGSVPAAGAVPPTTTNPVAGTTAPATDVPSATAPAKGEQIAVRTDLFAVDLNTLGATIDRIELLKYRDTADTQQNFVLLDQTPGYYYVAQTGLVGAAGGVSLPTHRTPFTAVPGPRALEPGQDTLDVSFEAQAGGVKVVKTYTFKRGSYQIGVRHAVTNVGDQPLSPQLYLQLVRDDKSPAGGVALLQHLLRPGRVQRPREVPEGQLLRHREGQGAGQARRARRRRLGRDAAALLRRRRGSRRPGRATTTPIASTPNLFRAGLREPLGTIAPGATLNNDARLYVGSERRAHARRRRAGARTGARLRLGHDHREADVLAAREDPRVDRQLGLVDHPADDLHQGGVLPAVGRELQVDGADEEPRAADEGAAGALQGRSRRR